MQEKEKYQVQGLSVYLNLENLVLNLVVEQLLNMVVDFWVLKIKTTKL